MLMEWGFKFLFSEEEYTDGNSNKAKTKYFKQAINSMFMANYWKSIYQFYFSLPTITKP